MHFGHQTRRWNPKMRRYIFSERGGIYIIDLQKTQELLEEAHRLRAEPRRARRDDALRRDEEAGPGRGLRARRTRRHAVREPPLARRPAHELAHDLRPHRLSARPPPTQGRGSAGPPSVEGADDDGERPRQARGESRRRGRHEAAAGRGLRHRPEEGAARRPRGAAARECPWSGSSTRTPTPTRRTSSSPETTMRSARATSSRASSRTESLRDGRRSPPPSSSGVRPSRRSRATEEEPVPAEDAADEPAEEPEPAPAAAVVSEGDVQ